MVSFSKELVSTWRAALSAYEMNKPTSTDLTVLMELVDKGYPFDDGDRVHFALAHSLLHMQKALGAIATVLEAHDHGQPLDTAALEFAVCKELVNVLKLAAVLGIPPAQLADHIGINYDPNIKLEV